MGTRQNTTARPAWALLPTPWIAALGAALMIAGAVIPYRYFPVHAEEPGPAQTLIDLDAGGALWWFAITNLPLLTFLVLAVVSVSRVVLRGPDPWGRGLQLGTGSIGTLWMAGLVGATWDPPVSPAAGAYLWIAGGFLLLLSGQFLSGDRDTDAPVSPSRREPLLAFLAVAVGLFATAEVVGAISLKNYVVGASLWVAGIVAFLAGATWAVVAGTRMAATNPTALRRAGVAATVIGGAGSGRRRTPGPGGEVLGSVRPPGQSRPTHLLGDSTALDGDRLRRGVSGGPRGAGPRGGARGAEVEDVVRHPCCPGGRGASRIHQGDVGPGHPSGRDLGCRRFPWPRRGGVALGRRSTGPAARGSRRILN
jgi:hypothetical protein